MTHSKLHPHTIDDGVYAVRRDQKSEQECVTSAELQSQIGAFIANAREKKNLTIENISEKIKIRRFFLEAIEEGRFDRLPGGIYTIGFIKAYTRYLDLDADEIILALSKTEGFLIEVPEVKNYHLESYTAFTNRWTILASVFIVFFGFGYLAYQARSLSFDPLKQFLQKNDIISKHLEPLSPAELSLNSEFVIKNYDLKVCRATWIKITTKEGHLVTAKMLKPGDIFSLQPYAAHFLSAGDMHALIFNGVTPPPNLEISSEIPVLLENFEIHLS